MYGGGNSRDCRVAQPHADGSNCHRHQPADEYICRYARSQHHAIQHGNANCDSNNGDGCQHIHRDVEHSPEFGANYEDESSPAYIDAIRIKYPCRQYDAILSTGSAGKQHAPIQRDARPRRKLDDHGAGYANLGDVWPGNTRQRFFSRLPTNLLFRDILRDAKRRPLEAPTAPRWQGDR